VPCAGRGEENGEHRRARAPKTEYLKAYDAGPAAEKFKLVRGWMKSEPLAFFKQLRAERPVLQTPECTLVAMFPDVRDILQMPKIFTVDLYKPKMGVTETDVGYLMAHDDDALHYREKSLMQGLLNRDDLPHVRNLVARRAERLLKEAGGRIELVNRYCRMVPVYLVQDYFGLDGIDREDLIRWSYWNQYDAFHNQPFDLRSDDDYERIVEMHNGVTTELRAYIAALVLRKVVALRLMGLFRMVLSPVQRLLYRLLGMAMSDKPDDIVTRMLRTKFAKRIDFPLSRAGVNAGGLLIGAIETTSQAVAQTVEYLIRNPTRMAEAKNLARSGDQAGFDALVREVLRFVPISPYSFRKASREFTIAKGTKHETRIAQGEIVLLLTQSAMFDPYAYKNPDRFDPKRTLYHNFTLGYGPHECLGKYIGMEMIPEMVRQVVLLENLKADGKISYENTTYFPDKNGPFPESYQVSWG